MSNRTIPYTSDDLRRIADELDEIITTLGDPDLSSVDKSWLWDLVVTLRDDAGYEVGALRASDDGWLGFYPLGMTS